MLGAHFKARKRSDIRHEHLADGPGFEVGQARGRAHWNIFACEARRQVHAARFVRVNEYDSDQRTDKHPRAANASPLDCKRVIADTRKSYRGTLRATVVHRIAKFLLRFGYDATGLVMCGFSSGKPNSMPQAVGRNQRSEPAKRGWVVTDRRQQPGVGSTSEQRCSGWRTLAPVWRIWTGG